MTDSEFDKFADNYETVHQSVLGVTGEQTGFFAEYKVKYAANYIRSLGIRGKVDILDFGCGVGTSIHYFHQYLPDCFLVNLDPSPKSLKVAKQRFRSSQFVNFDGSDIPFKDCSFDVVFTACVFHHIPHAEHLTILKELFRILRPGGVIVVFEHNPANFLTVRAVKTCPLDKGAVLIRATTLSRLIREAKFVEEKLHYTLFFPRFVHFLRPLEKYMHWIPLGAQFYVGAIKK